MLDPKLPRLLYLGDVPVEASYHGSALIYRLLETYPKGKLLILEAGTSLSLPARRLPDVLYLERKAPLSRLRTTRFSSYYFDMSLLCATTRALGFKSAAKRFGVEAVLTVTHGTAWITAASLAARLKVPLHLICHDEWVLYTSGRGRGLKWKNNLFSNWYRRASSRLCVPHSWPHTIKSASVCQGMSSIPAAHLMRNSTPWPPTHG